MIHLHDHNLSDSDIQLIADIDYTFFDGMTIDIWFKQRKNSRWAGLCTSSQKKIQVFNAHYSSYHFGGVIHTILHELGHMYHYWYDRADYDAKTNYGHEDYAEEFVQCCLLGALDYRPKIQTEHKATYKGAYNGTIYNEKFVDISYTDNGSYKYAHYFGANIKIYAHYHSGQTGHGYYQSKFMYTFEIEYHGKVYNSSKHVKLDTAKKDVQRKLRKWGIIVN